MKYLLILTVIVLALTSCYYDNEEALYPSLSQGCDTSAVKFSTSVKPLLTAKCLSCHSNSTAASFGNNIKLENYADVKTNAAQVLASVKHTAGYSPMPKNGGKLGTCEIAILDIWIKNGMLND